MLDLGAARGPVASNSSFASGDDLVRKSRSHSFRHDKKLVPGEDRYSVDEACSRRPRSWGVRNESKQSWKMSSTARTASSVGSVSLLSPVAMIAKSRIVSHYELKDVQVRVRAVGLMLDDDDNENEERRYKKLEKSLMMMSTRAVRVSKSPA